MPWQRARRASSTARLTWYAQPAPHDSNLSITYGQEADCRCGSLCCQSLTIAQQSTHLPWLHNFGLCVVAVKFPILAQMWMHARPIALFM